MEVSFIHICIDDLMWNKVKEWDEDILFFSVIIAAFHDLYNIYLGLETTISKLSVCNLNANENVFKTALYMNVDWGTNQEHQQG